MKGSESQVMSDTAGGRSEIPPVGDGDFGGSHGKWDIEILRACCTDSDVAMEEPNVADETRIMT